MTAKREETVRISGNAWLCSRCDFGGPRVTVAQFRRHYQRAHPELCPVRIRYPVFFRTALELARSGP